MGVHTAYCVDVPVVRFDVDDVVIVVVVFVWLVTDVTDTNGEVLPPPGGGLRLIPISGLVSLIACNLRQINIDRSVS